VCEMKKCTSLVVPARQTTLCARLPSRPHDHNLDPFAIVPTEPVDQCSELGTIFPRNGFTFALFRDKHNFFEQRQSDPCFSLRTSEHQRSTAFQSPRPQPIKCSNRRAPSTPHLIATHSFITCTCTSTHSTPTQTQNNSLQTS
jgi:hypothetical protein